MSWYVPQKEFQILFRSHGLNDILECITETDNNNNNNNKNPIKEYSRIL